MHMYTQKHTHNTHVLHYNYTHNTTYMHVHAHTHCSLFGEFFSFCVGLLWGLSVAELGSEELGVEVISVLVLVLLVVCDCGGRGGCW